MLINATIKMEIDEEEINPAYKTKEYVEEIVKDIFSRGMYEVNGVIKNSIEIEIEDLKEDY